MTIRSAIGAAIIGACAALLPFVASASSLKDITLSTFKLYDGSGSGYCSTTFLKNDKDGALFLTAAHCADEKGMNVRVQHIDPKNLRDVLSEDVYYVKAVKTLKSKDIAILQTRDKSAQIAASGIDIATVEEGNSVQIGDPVFAVGYPAAQALAVSKGEFTGKVPQVFGELDKDTPMYQTTVPVAGGSSGGALYATFDGTYKLIGTTTGMRTDNALMTWFQTAETVNEALRGYGIGTKVTEAPKPAPIDGSLNIDDR